MSFHALALDENRCSFLVFRNNTDNMLNGFEGPKLFFDCRSSSAFCLLRRIQVDDQGYPGTPCLGGPQEQNKFVLICQAPKPGSRPRVVAAGLCSEVPSGTLRSL